MPVENKTKIQPKQGAAIIRSLTHLHLQLRININGRSVISIKS